MSKLSLSQPKVANPLVGALLLLLVLLACRNAFIQDDAFISFRYAAHLVNEQGLTWNVGDMDKIEGYTNFLWILLIALVLALDLEPVASSQVIGIAFALGTLLVTYRLALRVFHSTGYAILCITLLGTNYTFSAYATGGLETQMHTFLVTSSVYLALVAAKRGAHRPSQLAFLSLLFSASLLTRLDAMIPVIVLTLFVLFHLKKQPLSAKDLAFALGCLVIPTLAIIGTWLAWKYSYYGSVLPNTYYAKAEDFSLEILREGLIYIFGFFYSYKLIPFVFLAVVFAKRLLSERDLMPLFAIVILWLGYIAKVGGDFMEFRFFVPILPVIFLLIVSTIKQISARKLQAGLVALVMAGTFLHATMFHGNHGTESIKSLDNHITSDSQQWGNIGRTLKEYFHGSEPPVVIATTAAGAIPYYSQLPTLDLLGLNDAWIARNGTLIQTRSGHRRLATLDYIIKKEVNLLIGHPHVVFIDASSGPFLNTFREYFGAEFASVPDTARIIELPLGSGYKIAVLYLKQSPYIDTVIDHRNLRTYEITGRP